jgi:hypothetical protein
MMNLIHSDVGTGGTPQTHINNVTIRNLKFINLDSPFNANMPKYISSLYADDVLIEGNYFTLAGNEGIWPAGSPMGTRWIVTKNTFKASGLNAIANGHDGGAYVANVMITTFENNLCIDVHECAGAGVNLNRFAAIGNIILGVTTHGIGIGENATLLDTQVSDNIIYVASDTNLAAAPRAGITLLGNTSNVSISNNVIHYTPVALGNSFFGIHLNSPNLGCKVSDNNIYLDVSNVSLTAGRSAEGIHLDPGADHAVACVFSNNSIHKAGPSTFSGYSGIIANTNSNTDNIDIAISGGFIKGFVAGSTQYAIRLINTGAGVVRYAVAGLITDGGCVQFDPANPDCTGNYANVPINANSDSDMAIVNGGIQLGCIPFASLAARQNGDIKCCSDCKVTSGADNTCTNGGSGAFAFRLGGNWRCFALQN